MITVRALLRDGRVTFSEKVDLPDPSAEYEILVTFLDPKLGTTLYENQSGMEIQKISARVRLDLSAKDIEILKLVQLGFTNGRIAEKLEITHGTARNNLSSIYEKLKVTNRTGAIAKAIEYGLID